MKIIITTGGTGGHIYPALALINKIKEKEQAEILFIGTHNRMEKEIIPKHNLKYKAIKIYGLNRKNIFKNIKTIKSLIVSYKKTKKIIKEFKPDIVIGFGNYVSVPVLYRAAKMKIPTIIHEQNSIPGKANLFLSKYVDKIAVSLNSAKTHFPKNKTVWTGNPCSEDALKQKIIPKSKYKLNKNKKLVYIVMGSLGSSKINEFLIKTMSLFNNKDYEVLFITGKEHYNEIKKNNFPSNVFIEPYIENQTGLLKNVDLIITRCGATTLSEIIALQLPAILIPSPYVTNNHQYKNAMDLVNKNAAHLLEEKDLKGDKLVREIDKLINNSKKLNQYITNLKSLGKTNSATLLYNEIKKIQR